MSLPNSLQRACVPPTFRLRKETVNKPAKSMFVYLSAACLPACLPTYLPACQRACEEPAFRLCSANILPTCTRVYLPSRSTLFLRFKYGLWKERRGIRLTLLWMNLCLKKRAVMGLVRSCTVQSPAKKPNFGETNGLLVLGIKKLRIIESSY
jgi:hypothetical protein